MRSEKKWSRKAEKEIVQRVFILLREQNKNLKRVFVVFIKQINASSSCLMDAPSNLDKLDTPSSLHAINNVLDAIWNYFIFHVHIYDTIVLTSL